jgi:hypothetical protein
MMQSSSDMFAFYLFVCDAAVLVVRRCGALATNHRVACVAASSAAVKPARRWLKVSPEEPETLREQIKSLDDITAIDDEVRGIVVGASTSRPAVFQREI